MIGLIRQQTPTTCGQACLAMLLDIIPLDAERLIGHANITTEKEMLAVLVEDNFGDGKPLVKANARFLGGKPPNTVVALQLHRDPKGTREHWTVIDNGKLLDPAMIGKKLWPVVKYLVVNL